MNYPSHAPVPRGKLLVVDDEVDILEVLSEYLESCGYEVCTVSSGREALASLRSQDRPFDLALVDWNLPGIAGRDVITDLRELSPTTRIIVLTGSFEPRMGKLKGGVFGGVLVKPFSLTSLIRRIEETLGMERERVCG